MDFQNAGSNMAVTKLKNSYNSTNNHYQGVFWVSDYYFNR